MRTIKDRIELHNVLKSILKSNNVYYQPPQNTKMLYPAIRYNREKIDDISANNKAYIRNKTYRMTYISEDPDDDDVIDAICDLPHCEHLSHYVADGLNHDAFRISL